MGHTFKKILGPALGVALVITVAPYSKADTFDTSLTSPPGVYFGSGNANKNFTTETNGTTELGLSVIQRYVGPIDPGGSNVYQVLTGPTTVPTKTGSWWGFDFSVNTQYNGGTAVLNDFNYSLNITDLTTGNVGPTFDPINPPFAIPDNTGYGSGGKTANTVDLGAQWGVQNSEALSFAGFLPGYDINASDVYQITFSELDKSNNVIETDTVFASAVPEPTSIFLFGTLAIGALVLGRRRLSAAKPKL